MAVQFGSHFTISSAGKATLGDWDVKVSQNGTFGSDGVTWIDGGRHNRPVEIPVWIYGGYGTRQQLVDAIELINAKANQRGTLTNDSTEYGECRFVTLRESHPIHYSGQHSSWMFRGVAVFVQVKPR